VGVCVVWVGGGVGGGGVCCGVVCVWRVEGEGGEWGGGGCGMGRGRVWEVEWNVEWESKVMFVCAVMSKPKLLSDGPVCVCVCGCVCVCV